jgi:uncharacterized membrane protein
MEFAAKSIHLPNTGNVERAAYVVAGTLFAYYGMRKRSLWGTGMSLLGAHLVHRGATGSSLFGLGSRTRIDRSVSIQKPKAEVFSFWRNLSNLPQFMCRLKSVRATAPTTSHWVANAPGGRTVEWDAEIINEVENEIIAWKSLPGAAIGHAGSVRFEDASGGRGTIVRVSVSYGLPGGTAVSTIAKLLGADPAADLAEDLRRLKAVLEAGQIANTSGQVSGKVPEPAIRKDSEARVREASENSFPASDAPAYQ